MLIKRMLIPSSMVAWATAPAAADKASTCLGLLVGNHPQIVQVAVDGQARDAGLFSSRWGMP